MSARSSLLAALSLITLLAACHTPFTRGFRENHGLSAPEVQQIQFYTSGRILLRRSVNKQTRGNDGAKFDIRGQVEVEEVDIDSGTPCVAVDVRDDYIAVSFTPGDRDRVLWFSTVDSPERGRYALTHLIDFPKGTAKPRYSSGYTIRYGSLDYQLVEPKDWSVYLLFDKDVSLDRDLRRHTPDGWRISEDTSAHTHTGKDLQ